MISPEDVQKLAALARIQLTHDEEVSLAKDMENILDFVAQIQSVSGSEDGVIGSTKEKVRNVLREDLHPHQSGIHTEAILHEAPQREGDYIKVKKILGS
jgi:aspartyl-tRNA(Asn)/glutamyl-tRNA(Gln) amidotransferase subunit C